MLKAIISDFARVILFPKDEAYPGSLGTLHGKLLQDRSQYNILDYFTINEELLEFYESLKPDYALLLFTESANIQKTPEIKVRMERVFQFIFTPTELGMLKTDPRSYLHIAEQLKLKPEEILFIDDRMANLQAAQKVGVQTVQYVSNEQLFEDLAVAGIKKK